MQNTNIRNYAKSRGIFLWQIAYELGITDATLSRKLRIPLPSDETARIMQIIDELAAKKTEVR